jgi:preprotein translocase subunit SecG
MLYAIMLILHILVAVLLMAVVLMQQGRGGAMGSAFGGGGGNQTLFGGRGATSFLTKATWVLGGGFMVTSLILALAIGQRQGTSGTRSLLKENPISIPAGSAPAVPGGAPATGGEAPGSPVAPR